MSDSIQRLAAPLRRSKARKTLLSVLRCWQVYVMLLPALIYIILFAYKSMYGVLIAFKTYKMKLGIMGSPWCGLDNFYRLFNSYWFPITVRNTLTLSLLSLVLGFPLPIILALMLNELKSEGIRRTIQTVSYAPHFISTVVLCSMVTLFLSPSSGAINKFIEFFGGKPVSFMASAPMFKWIYVLSGVWQGVGWSSIIFTAALAGVDRSLLEAADIDGATRIQKIWYVNVPVLIPTIVIMLILQCGSLLSVGYEKVYLLQNDFNMTASEVISTYTYKVGLEQADFAFSTAVGVLNSVVNSIILIIVNAISRRVSETALW